ncbi:MAG: P-loop NTPase [Alphaproteobacteria bacterium]
MAAPRKDMIGDMKNRVLQALGGITAPDSPQDIVTCGMVEDIHIDLQAGEVICLMKVTPQQAALMEPIRLKAEKTIRALDDVQKSIRKVSVILTAERTERTPLPAEMYASQKTDKSDPHGLNKVPVLDLPIRHIIAVASGKGGVGKSTIACNSAVLLAKNGQSSGLRVGILDADIYGPSQPRLLGVQDKKPSVGENGRLDPLDAYGIKIMSIGFMVEEERAMIWRGPMVQTAIIQLLRDVNWGSAETPLDVLIVDMPPGTGDAQLTMAQKVKLSGAVIVSTPQDIALIDARKGLEMFKKTNVPILGLVENMSTHICSKCGHEEHIFGHGGVESEAQKLGVPFLGAIPLHGEIRMRSDAGRPVVLDSDNASHVQAYGQIANKIFDFISND